jgi:hypothetical protein
MVADHQGGEHQGGMSVALPVFGYRICVPYPNRIVSVPYRSRGAAVLAY